MGNVQSETASFTPSDVFFLAEAAKEGNSDVIALFLKKNPALASALLKDKSTAWHSAAQGGHVKVLQLLVTAVKEPTLPLTGISTAQEPQSSVSGTTSISAGDSASQAASKVVNLQNSKGQTALMLACKGGHHQCAELLLSNGADMTLVDAGGLNALHYAALHASGTCTVLLLNHVNVSTSAGQSGLAATEEQKFSKLVNSKDAYGRTPLHYAAWSGQADGAMAIMAVGGDYTLKTSSDCYDSDLPCNNGTTPLHLAAMKGQRGIVIAIMAAFVQASLDKGKTQPDPRTAVDTYGNTPFIIAASRRHDDTVMMNLLNPNTIITEMDAVGSSTQPANLAASSSGLSQQRLQQLQQQHAEDDMGSPMKNERSPLLGDRGPAGAHDDSDDDGPHDDLNTSPVPDCFLCPLTCKVFKDPVVAADGNTFERAAIERHFATGSLLSPVTKQRLASSTLYPNLYLRKALEYWLETNQGITAAAAGLR